MARGENVQAKTAGYGRDNLAAARVILADPAKYGGPDGLPVRWAQLVVERQDGSRQRNLEFERRAADER
jgi:hypothetical protein